MLKYGKWVVGLVCAALAFGVVDASYAASARKEYPKFSQEERAAFYERLDKEIGRSGRQIEKMIDDVSNFEQEYEGDFRTLFEDRLESLEVKRVLFKNFHKTSSIDSPVVRARLLHLFHKDVITKEDLQTFDRVVEDEKLKMGRYD